VDTPALKPPPRAEASDIDRQARTVQRPPDPKNPLPFSRGNTTERVEAADASRSRTESPVVQPEPAAGTRTSTATTDGGEGSGSGPTVPPSTTGPAISSSTSGLSRGDNGRARESGGSLGDTLRNLQKFVQQDSFSNPQGGQGAWGPSIQFDTKGVEFGPWIRRFIAQIKRNWFVPYAAMALKGHVVIQFNVHKDGRISDLNVVGASQVEAFNHAAFNALAASNPTMPLPTEYPSDKAFFTVTFYYNETPPTQ
jgi:TonB family protein